MLFHVETTGNTKQIPIFGQGNFLKSEGRYLRVITLEDKNHDS